jgi:hypothetical protein
LAPEEEKVPSILIIFMRYPWVEPLSKGQCFAMAYFEILSETILDDAHH